MPISFDIPMTVEFSTSKRGGGFYDFEDDGISNSIGSHFTHREDVAARISLLAPDFQAISILSGSSPISSFTIGLPDSSISK